MYPNRVLLSIIVFGLIFIVENVQIANIQQDKRIKMTTITINNN